MADLPDGFFNLKHRLVGATVLILAAVILLPRALTGTDVLPVRSSVNARTTPQVQPQVLSEVTPSDYDPAEVSTRTRIEILEQPTIAGLGDGTESMLSSNFDSSDHPVSKSIVTGFIVQVGIFQRPENTRNLISILKNDGIEAKAETILMNGRQATRIWLGPFSTRFEATREGNKAMIRTHNKPIVKEWP